MEKKATQKLKSRAKPQKPIAKKGKIAASKKTSTPKRISTKSKTVRTTKRSSLKSTSPKTTQKKVSVIPKGYHSVTPYLISANASKSIAFYKSVFGAKEVLKMERPGSKIAHCELKIGDAKIMLADECPEMDTYSPKAYGGCGANLYLYVKNVDKTIEQALNEGATLLRAIEDMFYGDRSGAIIDPDGHRWHIATHIEDVSPAKLKKRAAELYHKK